MTGFLLVFPLVAILSVPLLAWLMLRAASREAEARGHILDPGSRGLRRLLGVGTLLCVGFLALRAVIPPHLVPPNVLSLLVALAGFQGLWWAMAMPLVRAQDAALRAERGSATNGRRVASLRQRRVSDYLPGSLLSVPWVIAFVGCALLAWRLFVAAVSTVGIIGAGVFVLCALGELVLYRWWLRAEVKAPQNLGGVDPGGLELEWESLRRFRVRAVFVMHCVMPAVFLTFGTLMLEASRGSISGAALGIAGGTVGIVLGLAGGAFGVLADIHRRRLEVRRTL